MSKATVMVPTKIDIEKGYAKDRRVRRGVPEISHTTPNHKTPQRCGGKGHANTGQSGT
ncbi:MAG: hypothetical protein ACI84R_001033, partial [Candidatus Azotimanducaceae bacterium]